MNKMKIKLATTLAVTLCFGFLGLITFTALAQEAPKITKEEVLGMLGNPDVIIIDVRSGGDWNGSELKIKGALREDSRNVSSWIEEYPKDKTLVFYCA
jgi:3-mercaptopyruvate sulfurtransferase SseA